MSRRLCSEQNTGGRGMGDVGGGRKRDTASAYSPPVPLNKSCKAEWKHVYYMSCK